MKNLVLFGDSMLGYLGTSLIKKIEFAVPNLHIHNCAVGGATTEDGLKKVDYIASLKPDIVLLSFGINDIFKNNLSLDKLIENLIKIVNSFNNSRVIIWLTPRANDIDDIDGTNKFNSKIAEYNDEVRKYCKENKIEFIDSFTEYQIEVGKPDPYHEDDIHLSDEGYQPFIESLVELLKK